MKEYTAEELLTHTRDGFKHEIDTLHAKQRGVNARIERHLGRALHALDRGLVDVVR